MKKIKRPYIKLEMTIIPAGSPKYNEIIDLLKVEDAKAKKQEIISTHPTAIQSNF